MMIIPAYYTPNELDLKGRLPEDLPNRTTIDDILLELEDTNLFNIRWIDPSQFDWKPNNKNYSQWIESGKAVVHKAKFDKPLQFTGEFTESTIRIEETRYDIFRYPQRLNIEYKGEQSKPNFNYIYELCKSVYERLSNYIGIDVIQNQFLYTNFQIDFMISECKII
jgi:hypothetical protein